MREVDQMYKEGIIATLSNSSRKHGRNISQVIFWAHSILMQKPDRDVSNQWWVFLMDPGEKSLLKLLADKAM